MLDFQRRYIVSKYKSIEFGVPSCWRKVLAWHPCTKRVHSCHILGIFQIMTVLPWRECFECKHISKLELRPKKKIEGLNVMLSMSLHTVTLKLLFFADIYFMELRCLTCFCSLPGRRGIY